jgi:hypothetical protein
MAVVVDYLLMNARFAHHLVVRVARANPQSIRFILLLPEDSPLLWAEVLHWT